MRPPTCGVPVIDPLSRSQLELAACRVMETNVCDVIDMLTSLALIGKSTGEPAGVGSSTCTRTRGVTHADRIGGRCRDG